MNELNNDLGNGLRGIIKPFERKYSEDNLQRFKDPINSDKIFETKDEVNLENIGEGESVYIKSEAFKYIKVNGVLVTDNIIQSNTEINTNNSLPLVSPTVNTDDQNASEVPLDTTNFNKNLSSADDTIQKAMDTIDDLEIEIIDGGTF